MRLSTIVCCILFAVGFSVVSGQTAIAASERAPYWQWRITPFHWHNGMHNPCIMQRQVSTDVKLYIEALRDGSWTFLLQNDGWQFPTDDMTTVAWLEGGVRRLGTAAAWRGVQGDRVVKRYVGMMFEGLTEQDLFGAPLTISVPNFPPYTIPAEVRAELHKRIGECGQR